MSNQASIELVPGTVAPRYERGIEVTLAKIVITEQGTQAKLPLVDFVLQGQDGSQYLLVLNGRVVNAISAAIKGVNMRNHGVAEP